MSDKQERMSDLDFGRYESPSANSLTLKESRSAYWAVVAECRRARLEEEIQTFEAGRWRGAAETWEGLHHRGMEDFEELEKELADARAVNAEKRQQALELSARIMRLHSALELAQEQACRVGCPHVWRLVDGERTRHTDSCLAAISALHGAATSAALREPTKTEGT